MTRPRASVHGRGHAWRRVVSEAIAAHVRIHGSTCPGWGVPAHWSADLTGDHVIPVSAGGLSTRANVAVLCRACNSRKGDAPARLVQLTLDGQALPDEREDPSR